ncbi:MAG TPA: HAMP domain-containing sensor histidine kinase [Labilithrix sp.]|nr:HAMP domain-containing sensor histidine kinase [Labilithrix sp.]
MLGGITMSAALLDKVDTGHRESETLHREVRRIQRYVARMTRLIGDLLDVTRFEAGKLQIVADVDDPVPVLEEAFEGYRPQAAMKKVDMSCHVSDEPLRALFDAERILQVLGNLIGNAIKFTPEDGHIALRVTRVKEEVWFEVTDTGRGIPEDALGTIFERFAQATHDNRTGLGLGLYISRRIVEAHGGRIWAESQQGSGSSFRFALPVAPRPSA